MESEKENFSLQPKKEKRWFKIYKGGIKLFKKRVKFYYLGKKFDKGCLILSNHESTKGPLGWDFYCDTPVRLVGAVEMNSGLKQMYKYQSEIYYHQKKHWNLVLAKLFCLLASPMTNIFYKGLDLISIRRGFEFKHTISDVYKALSEFHENIVIFPEDSTNGYLPQLEGFKVGFVLICERCLKKGYDVPIVVSYFKRKEHVTIVDEPIYYSQLKEKYQTREAIAEHLKDRCNELGRMDVNELKNR